MAVRKLSATSHKSIKYNVLKRTIFHRYYTNIFPQRHRFFIDVLKILTSKIVVKISTEMRMKTVKKVKNMSQQKVDQVMSGRRNFVDEFVLTISI